MTASFVLHLPRAPMHREASIGNGWVLGNLLLRLILGLNFHGWRHGQKSGEKGGSFFVQTRVPRSFTTKEGKVVKMNPHLPLQNLPLPTHGSLRSPMHRGTSHLFLLQALESVLRQKLSYPPGISCSQIFGAMVWTR